MNGENNSNHYYEFDDVNNQILFHKFIMINEVLDRRNKKQNPEMKKRVEKAILTPENYNLLNLLKEN